MHCIHNGHISDVIIFPSLGKLSCDSFMPHTDSIHSNRLSYTDPVFNIIPVNKQRKRISLFLDFLYRNTAIPPAAILRTVLFCILQQCIPVPKIKAFSVSFDTPPVPVCSAFKLFPWNILSEKRACQLSILILFLQHRKKTSGPFQNFRFQRNIIIHQDHMSKFFLLYCFQHSSGKATCSTAVFVGNISHKLRKHMILQGVSIVNNKNLRPLLPGKLPDLIDISCDILFTPAGTDHRCTVYSADLFRFCINGKIPQQSTLLKAFHTDPVNLCFFP